MIAPRRCSRSPGTLEIWHLAIVAFVLGIADGFFYPAYSALLPSILPADQLLAANGVEGMLRPAVMQALGPALASVVDRDLLARGAFVVVGVAQLLAVVGLAWLRTTPVRRELDDEHRHPLAAMFVDIRDGFAYMVRTPWLLATLLYARLLVLVDHGADRGAAAVRGDRPDRRQAPAAFALVLAAFGIGGAIGSLVVASLRLPRRYLTVMNLLLGRRLAPARRRRLHRPALGDGRSRCSSSASASPPAP